MFLIDFHSCYTSATKRDLFPVGFVYSRFLHALSLISKYPLFFSRTMNYPANYMNNPANYIISWPSDNIPTLCNVIPTSPGLLISVSMQIENLWTDMRLPQLPQLKLNYLFSGKYIEKCYIVKNCLYFLVYHQLFFVYLYVILTFIWQMVSVRSLTSNFRHKNAYCRGQNWISSQDTKFQPRSQRPFSLF